MNQREKKSNNKQRIQRHTCIQSPLQQCFDSQVLLFLTARWRRRKDDKTSEGRRGGGGGDSEVREFCVSLVLRHQEEECRCVKAGLGEREREKVGGRVGQDSAGVGIGGIAARSSFAASLCLCVHAVCLGDCVLFCPFRSHGRNDAHF